MVGSNGLSDDHSFLVVEREAHGCCGGLDGTFEIGRGGVACIEMIPNVIAPERTLNLRA